MLTDRILINEESMSLRYDKENRIDKHSNEICFYSLYGLGFLLFGLFYISYLCYLISGLVFLIQDKSISETCNSNIWIYCIVSVISGIISIFNFKGKSEENKNFTISRLLILSFLNLGLGIIGFYEYETTDCQALEDSSIFIWTQVSSMIQIITGIVSIVFFCIFCYKESSN